MTTILEAPYMMVKKQDPGEPPLQVNPFTFFLLFNSGVNSTKL